MTLTTFTWNTQAGLIELPDGEMVIVRCGDTLEGYETDTGIVFVEHHPVTRH